MARETVLDKMRARSRLQLFVEEDRDIAIGGCMAHMSGHLQACGRHGDVV